MKDAGSDIFTAMNIAGHFVAQIVTHLNSKKGPPGRKELSLQEVITI